MKKVVQYGVFTLRGAKEKFFGKWANNFGTKGVFVPLPSGNILQQDNVSFILQEDGVSKIITEA